MTRRIIYRVSLLIVGLALAACGGQPDVNVEPPTTSEQPIESRALVSPGGIEEDLGLDEAPVSDEEIPHSLALSPLAENVTELPSALPERALEGFGDPIGRPPVTLSLPQLGVDGAAVVPAGLEPNGEFEVPGATEVGWYRFGVGVDGGAGSAVLAAHIAYNGRDGVFRNLADSNVGDELVVNDGQGDLAYRVVSIDQYNKFELPMDDLFAETGEERIVLITCGGSFNPDVQSYDDNVVVVAVRA